MSEAKTVWLPFVENFRISPGAAAFSSATGLIKGVRGKEIACGVKGEAKTLPGKRTKRALGSARRKSKK